MGINVGYCHAILTGKLQMHRVSAKFVLHLLIDGHKENRASISQDMLANADADNNFLKNRLFSIPHIENHFERTSFPKIEEVKENATRQLRAIK
jgi:hypothetical protein